MASLPNLSGLRPAPTGVAPTGALRGSERGREAAQQALVSDFMSIGADLLDSMILTPVSPLHYDKLLNLVRFDDDGNMAFVAADSAANAALREGLAQFGIHAGNMQTLVAVLWAAYDDYKTALDIATWEADVKDDDENWWEYWNHVDDHAAMAGVLQLRIRSDHHRNARTVGELRESAQRAASTLSGRRWWSDRIRGFPRGRTAPAISRGEELNLARVNGWTPEYLVARSTLTLWVVLFAYRLFTDANPLGDSGPIDEMELATIDRQPAAYAQAAVANPALRVRRAQ